MKKAPLLILRIMKINLMTVIITVILLLILFFAYKEIMQKDQGGDKMSISKTKAIELVVNESLKQGASASDIDAMEKRAEDKGDFYLVSIYPVTAGQKFDVSARVSKKDGKISALTMGAID